MYGNVFGPVYDKDVVTFVRTFTITMFIYTLFKYLKHPVIDMHSLYNKNCNIFQL